MPKSKIMGKKNSSDVSFIAYDWYGNFENIWSSGTVDSRYLEVDGTLWNTSRYPYFDISDVQNWGKYQSNNQISQMNL